MKPVLYASTEKNFNTNGLGTLSDALECTVTEERNGEYFITLIYPTEGKHFEKIAENSFIVVTVADGSRQRFIVKSMLTTINGHCQIYGEHFSYLLNGIPVKPCSANSPSDALTQAKRNSVVNNPFNFETSLKSTNKWSITAPRSFRNLLGGEAGSLLERYGGEYEWDNDRVILHEHRGSEQPIVISYGKDITDLTDDVDGTSAITGIYPYFQGESDVIVGDVVKAQVSAPFERIATEEVSQYMNIEGEAVPTKAQVTAAGRIALANRLVSATENLKISFVPIWQSEEYKTTLGNLKLCDTITVRYDKLGILRKTKVVKTVWDVLLDRYESIELGDIKTGLVGSIIDIKGSVVEVKETLKQEIQDTANEIYEYTDDAIEETTTNLSKKIEDGDKKTVEIIQDENGIVMKAIKGAQDTAEKAASKGSQLSLDIDTITSEVWQYYNPITHQGSFSKIEQASNKISQIVGGTDTETGMNIISKISQAPSYIKIEAKNIDLTGVTTIYDAYGNAAFTFNGNSIRCVGSSAYISYDTSVLNLTAGISGSIWLTGNCLLNSRRVLTEDDIPSIVQQAKG